MRPGTLRLSRPLLRFPVRRALHVSPRRWVRYRPARARSWCASHAGTGFSLGRTQPEPRMPLQECSRDTLFSPASTLRRSALSGTQYGYPHRARQGGSASKRRGGGVSAPTPELVRPKSSTVLWETVFGHGYPWESPLPDCEPRSPISALRSHRRGLASGGGLVTRVGQDSVRWRVFQLPTWSLALAAYA